MPWRLHGRPGAAAWLRDDLDEVAIRGVAPAGEAQGTEARPAWYVNDRLVVRLQDPTTLVVRVPDEREALLEAYPDTFGVPPRMEAHHKVEAYLEDAPPEAARGHRPRVDMQRRLSGPIAPRPARDERENGKAPRHRSWGPDAWCCRGAA